MLVGLKISFEELFRTMYPKLYFYARRLVGNEHDADDVVEEVFMELWKRRDAVDFNDNIEGFLFRAVYTRSINMLKRNNASREHVRMLDEINERRMELSAVDNNTPVSEMENDDLGRAIDAAISELPDTCRRVFIKSYVDGMRNKEIASELDLSVRTVENHVFRALRYLRERLGKIGDMLIITLFMYGGGKFF